jgi:hypothetical protein
VDRPLLVHLHMFKNAGTTVDSALESWFGDGFVAYDGPRPGHRIEPDEFRELVGGRESMSAISSHQLRLPLPEIPEIELLPMVFLREPLDRAQSVWAFERRQNSNSPGAVHAKKLSVDDYVRWRLGQAEISVISDFQAGVVGRDGPKGGVDVELAAARLSECAVVGAVERMHQSMFVAEHRLRRAIPEIDLSFKSRNVTATRATTAAERVADFLALIGPDLAAELRERNARDTEVHDLARRELDRRLDAIPDVDAALIDFDRRCRARERATRGRRAPSPTPG